MTTYTDAPAVETIARRLISAHHGHLAGVEIRYFFRDTAATSKGKKVLGKARLITGLNALLAEANASSTDEADPFFVVEVAEDVWSTLDGDQREALVDHELCHCTLKETDDGGVKLALRAHDLEEFRGVVERHGLWRTDVEDFAKSLTQQQLPFGDDAE
jgi:hypothetical protein